MLSFSAIIWRGSFAGLLDEVILAHFAAALCTIRHTSGEGHGEALAVRRLHDHDRARAGAGVDDASPWAVMSPT